jgi:hypothetical protein
MSTLRRRVLLFLGILAMGGACNPLYLPLFLTGKPQMTPAELYKLASKDKKKEVKAVILTYMGLETRPEFIQSDRDIARFLALHLKKLTEENEEKVSIVNPFKVEEYKNANPDWHSSHLDLREIGKHFKADYVIYIEVGSLSMYQPGSIGTFYRGQAILTVSLVNLNEEDDYTLPPREITFTYPREEQGGNEAVDADTPPQEFKLRFLNALARRLSWLFADRDTSDGYMNESQSGLR